MSIRKSFIVAGALAAAIGASPSITLAQPSAAQSAQDQRELNAYVLTMDVVNKVAKANKAALAAEAKDPAQQKLAKQKAELAALEAKEEPTEAEQERMAVLADEIARFEEDADEGDDQSGGVTIAEYVRRVEAKPEAAAAVRSAGLSSREYATATLALLQASITYGLLKEQMLKQAPPDISKQHLEFVRIHEKELAALNVFAQRKD